MITDTEPLRELTRQRRARHDEVSVRIDCALRSLDGIGVFEPHHLGGSTPRGRTIEEYIEQAEVLLHDARNLARQALPCIPCDGTGRCGKGKGTPNNPQEPCTNCSGDGWAR